MTANVENSAVVTGLEKVSFHPLSHEGGPAYSVKFKKKKKIQLSKIEALIGFIRVIHESIGRHSI